MKDRSQQCVKKKHGCVASGTGEIIKNNSGVWTKYEFDGLSETKTLHSGL